MKAAICAFVVAFALTAVLGTPVIRFLKKLKFGQKILEDGPTWHMNKQYTPTMGGIMFIAGLVGALCACLPAIWAAADLRPVLIFALSLIFGLIGMVDDYTKIKKKQNQGLTPLQKLLLQIAAAALFVTVLRSMGYITGHVYIPFVNVLWQVPWFVYLPCAIFVIVGAVNAVNLTDGLAGLAILPAAMVGSALGIFAYVEGRTDFAHYLLFPYIPGAGELVVVCAALAGAGLAFLWFNAHPAQVFMGDVGALALGGTLGTVAVITRQELVLAIMGGIFVVETLSVMIQTTYFRLSGGKRIFLMAPIHHHFELKGWKETQVVTRFWIITFILVLIGLSTLKIR